uniref:Pentacotripeptide-repeat region of PRORP domain-containing protein n=2 Tax=Nymphaea colorata TaxID=210225 RepID=A0A5K0X3P1_9MAGN
MKECHCSPDEFTYPLVVKACVGIWNLRLVEAIHSEVVKSGFRSDFFVQTSLVDGYCKFGVMWAASQVFDRMVQRDLVCWNALLCGYARCGDINANFETFRQILLMGFMPSVSTLVSLLPLCGRLGAVEVGKSVHGFAVKIGLNENETLVPTLITMYANSGHLEMCRQLFNEANEKDVLVWNSMISGYAQNELPAEALTIFRGMIRTNVKPDLVTLVSVIPSCGSLSNNCLCESLHGVGIKHGFQLNTSVGTALLSMYAKLGELDIAECMFDRMIEKNRLTWNAMVSAYIQNGRLNEALNALKGMQAACVKFDTVSLVGLVSICTQLQDLHLGKSVHASSIINGCNSYINLLNALLSMYADCGDITTAVTIFKTMPSRNVVSWNTMMSGYIRNGEFLEACKLFCQMQFTDFRFDIVTFINILPIYHATENLPEGKSIHGLIIKVGFDSDTSLVNALITMYTKCGDLECGLLLFEGMTTKSIVSWNTMMTGYGIHGLFKEVMALFKQMQLEKMKPNSVTLLNILPICQFHIHGKSIHAFAVRAGFVHDASLLTSLICMYGRFGNMCASSLLYKMADKRNVVVWNAIMSQYIQNGYAGTAMTAFINMIKIGTRPDTATILALVSACSQLGSLNLGKCITSYTIRKGFMDNIRVGNSLIDMHARCGNIKVSRAIFNSMPEKDLVSWSTMISAYGMHGDGSSANALFSQMKQEGIKPDSVIFVSILSACSHAGLTKKGKLHFDSMYAEYGILPKAEHYACMVDLFSRAGHLEEAYNFVNRMPFEPSAGMLESLLGACHEYGNEELGKRVCRRLSELDPQNFGSYMLLSNIYAASGKWLDANNLRVDMKDRGLSKTPGFSCIEVCG